MSGTRRTSREGWLIAIGVVALLAIGVGVVLQTDLFSLRTPNPTAEDVIPRDWGDDITGHQPIGGANSTAMDGWFDDVAEPGAGSG